MFRTIFAILWVLSSLFCSSPGQTAQTGQTGPMAQVMLLVGPENPPSEFTARNGDIRGFNADIAREALRRMGYTAKILIVPWNRALAMVRAGNADGILDAAFTPERKAFLRYPHTPINVEHLYAYQRSTTDIRLFPDLSDARKLRVGLLTGAAYGPRFTRQIANGTFAHVEYTVVPEHNLRKLLSKRMDMFIKAQQPLQKMAQRMGAEEKIKPVLSRLDGKPLLISTSKTYLAFSRKKVSQEFVEKIDHILEQMRDEGFMKKAHEVYE